MPILKTAIAMLESKAGRLKMYQNFFSANEHPAQPEYVRWGRCMYGHKAV